MPSLFRYRTRWLRVCDEQIEHFDHALRFNPKAHGGVVRDKLMDWHDAKRRETARLDALPWYRRLLAVIGRGGSDAGV